MCVSLFRHSHTKYLLRVSCDRVAVESGKTPLWLVGAPLHPDQPLTGV